MKLKRKRKFENSARRPGFRSFGRSRLTGFAAMALGLSIPFSACLQPPVRAQSEADPRTQALAGRNAPAAEPDKLVLFDGSSLKGELANIRPGNQVFWNHPAGKSALEFNDRNLKYIRFESEPENIQTVSSRCLFEFANGDELFGELISVNTNQVRLKPYLGGEMASPRESLRSLTFFSKAYSIVYQGPRSLEEWTVGPQPANNAWTYEDGKILGSGSGTLGRTMDLKGSSRVEFEISWTGHFYMVLSVYVKDVDRVNMRGNYYRITIQPGRIAAHRIQTDAPTLIRLGEVDVEAMMNRDRVKLAFQFNKEEQTLLAFANEELLSSWEDKRGFADEGEGILFSKSSSASQVELKQIKISTWEGNLFPDEQTPENQEGDFIFLTNHDKAAGRLIGVRDHRAVFDTSIAEFEIPVERVTQIRFKPQSDSAKRNRPGDVRAHFFGGGALSFQLLEWGEKTVRGESASFGEVTFSRQAIQQLDFNLNRSDPFGADESNFW